MKKAVNISFLILLVWQFVGVFIYFEASSFSVKNVANEILTQNKHPQIRTLHLSKFEFQKLTWLNKKEFRFYSKLYDVKKITSENDSYIIDCYMDCKEESLLQSMANFIEVKHSKSKKDANQTLIIKIIQSPIISNCERIETPHFVISTIDSKSFFFYKKKCLYEHLKKEIKPPIFRV